jgi:N-carbamoylputrescine amidase
MADREASLAHMGALADEAADAGADLILFPEAAATGLANNDDPQHDLPLAEPVPGPITARLAAMARRARAYLAAGILERHGPRLYDSAVLLDPRGRLALHYRRIQPQWHGRGADPRVYRQGRDVASAATPLGTLSILICGDLFDDAIVARVRALAPDALLFPFARNFSDGSFDQAKWDREEEAAYAARATAAGCTTLMANVLEDPTLTGWPSFGGAMAVSPDGEVLARWPLGRPGVLLVDV